MKVRNVLEGVGAMLLFVPYLPYLAPNNLLLYHVGLPVTNLIEGLLLDMLGLSVLAIGFLVAIQYLPPPIQRILIALFAGLMLWRSVDLAISMQTDMRMSDFWGRLRWQSCMATLLLSGLLACSLPRIIQPAVRVLRLALAAMALCALWIIPQLLHLALVRRPVQGTAPNQLSTFTSGSSNRRIIWILFDELSYDQTFDHPAPDMKLPNFDRLREESASLSNLKPAGFFTELIIPSLFLGRRIDRIRSTIDGDLWYHDDSQDRWLAFDPNATLFGLAQQNGWSSGVDGWFNPYCRILATVLNVCSWEPQVVQPMGVHGTSEAKSPFANATVMPNAILMNLNHHISPYTDPDKQEYRNLMARAHPLIENGQIRFVFLHLNIPHPPGIYDRKLHMLRSGGTYLDNLVLADDTLGTLLQELEATPSADQTTVIVSSDHSWRIPLWQNAEGWSAEEERACGGRFDDRPVLLIHFPDQKFGNNVSTALPELLEHDIIAGMLRGKINNPEDLAAQLAQYGH